MLFFYMLRPWSQSPLYMGGRDYRGNVVITAFGNVTLRPIDRPIDRIDQPGLLRMQKTFGGKSAGIYSC